MDHCGFSNHSPKNLLIFVGHPPKQKKGRPFKTEPKKNTKNESPNPKKNNGAPSISKSKSKVCELQTSSLEELLFTELPQNIQFPWDGFENFPDLHEQLIFMENVSKYKYTIHGWYGKTTTTKICAFWVLIVSRLVRTLIHVKLTTKRCGPFAS